MHARHVGTSLRPVTQTLLRVYEGVHHLIWPATCMNCRAFMLPGDRFLCQDCWGQLLSCTGSEYCPRCAREVSSYAVVGGRCALCADKSFYFDGIMRCGVYAECLQTLVLGFKKDRTEMRHVLGPLARSVFSASAVYERVDLLVPVPLHWTRRLARGYNQAQVIAKCLQTRRARVCRALRRKRRTPYQPTVATLPGRYRNVQGAFSVRKEAAVRDRCICLVDDIKTSGATLNECAKVLKQAGATEVYALVLAVAGQGLS